MVLKKIRNIKYADIAIPIVVFLLLSGLLFFVMNSLETVSQTNKNNFTYTVKIRDTIEEIDKIVERAEVNQNVITTVISNSYDISKLHDEKYNLNYVKKIDLLTKSVLMNSPGIDGAWFQGNIDLPFAHKVYSWYEYKNEKIVNLSNQYNSRTLNPEDDPYYFQAVKAKKTIWSDIYTDADTKVVMMTIAQPIYENGVLIGVAGVDISIKNLQQALRKMQSVFDSSEIFLLNQDNNIILSQLTKGKKIQTSNGDFLKLFNKKGQRHEGMVEYSDNGVKKTAIMLALSNNYEVVITFPNSLVFHGFDRLFKTIYFILSALIIVAMINIFNRYKMIKINTQLESELSTIRDIIDYSPTIMCVKDAKGRYLNCNQKFLDAVGGKKEDIIGKTDYELFDKTTADIVTKQDNDVMQKKECSIDEHWYMFANGEKKLLEKYRLPLFNENKESIGLLINSIDITKRHQEQEQLEVAKTAAEKATMMKSHFLANMSHEIRTPMNGVLGFLQLLEDTNPTREQKEFIQDAQKSSELLLNVINEILDFSKIEAGKLKIDSISFDIRSVVEDVIIMNTSGACKKGLEINSLICSDVPQKVFGDPSRVKQILNNLINNALKFTPEGEVVIYVNQDMSRNEDVIVSFKVKDTGIGIPEEKLHLIFESFTQADPSTTRKYGGTGLGLAISQKLAELMDGCLSVESELNEGTTFTLTLPFKKDESQSIAIDDSPESLKGLNILIIDNNLTDLNIIKYYLDEVNCIISEARTSDEALEIINNDNNKISAILIHYKMQNAGELTQLIKSNEKSKDIPLILLSSIAIRGDAMQARENGFAGYLTKPFKKHELIEAIEVAVKSKDENPQSELITKHFINENKFSAKTKILMVEDTELNCKFITHLLKRAGLSCDIAYEGKSAVEAFKSQKYDLILMDCQMPIMDGYEATREIRKIEGNNSHIPIIAMTANAMKTDEEKCYEAGMDAYISKPMKAEELLSLISKYIKLELENEEKIDSTDASETSDINSIENSIEKLILEVGFTKEEATQLFSEFLEFLSYSITSLESALDKNDYEEIKRLAHKLKGASANLRVDEISQVSAKIENECLNEDKDFCINMLNEIKKYAELLNSEKLNQVSA